MLLTFMQPSLLQWECSMKLLASNPQLLQVQEETCQITGNEADSRASSSSARSAAIRLKEQPRVTRQKRQKGRKAGDLHWSSKDQILFSLLLAFHKLVRHHARHG